MLYTDWCVLYGSSVGGYNEERALLARSQHNPRASEQLIPIHSAVVCPPAALFSWPRSGHYALSEGVRGAQPGHAPSADSEALGAFTGIPQGFHREFTGMSLLLFLLLLSLLLLLSFTVVRGVMVVVVVIVLVVVGIVAEVVLLFVLLFLSLFVHVTGGFSRRIVIVVVAVHGYGYF